MALEGADRLAGFMSMHDLAVTTTPIPGTGPIDVIWVRPQPLSHPDLQDVLIEHLATTGWDDLIVRPAPEAIRLFWRFTREKWGIEPVETPPDGNVAVPAPEST